MPCFRTISYRGDVLSQSRLHLWGKCGEQQRVVEKNADLIGELIIRPRILHNSPKLWQRSFNKSFEDGFTTGGHGFVVKFCEEGRIHTSRHAGHYTNHQPRGEQQSDEKMPSRLMRVWIDSLD